MTKALRYTDAADLLAGERRQASSIIDRLAGAALLAVAGAAGVVAGPAAGAAVAGLLDAKNEAVRLGSRLTDKLSPRLRGRDRYDRTELLTAAHSVIVITAFFSVLDDKRLRLPFDAAALELSRDEQLMMAADPGRQVTAESLAARLLAADVPAPAPHRSYEDNREAVRAFYAQLAGQLCVFASGLSLWDRLTETQRAGARTALRDRLVGPAVADYEFRYRRLCTEFPEFFVWSTINDQQATRFKLAEIRTSLQGMEELLRSTDHASAHPDLQRDLARLYQADLGRPLTETSTLEAKTGPRVPLLGDAYVNPGCRVRAAGPFDRPSEDAWWEAAESIADVQWFLGGHLTSLSAITAPLVILGQPGSGKSVLTRVLAARLAAGQFLPIRVELRRVQADAPLQHQIEEAVFQTTGDRVNWPDLSRGAAGALPVLLLDGFDELLQSAGINRSDYLEQIAEFQRRELELDRPVAVIVTSRTMVADRARFPAGSVALRLEPFTDVQVRSWLDTWNDLNIDYFDRTGLLPLAPEAALRHRALSAQPLLLMMLALYDAEGNALQEQAADMREADLYEQLLRKFTYREVSREVTDVTSAAFRRAMELELTRLSVVACAMFNRNRQTIHEDELDLDLTAILDGADTDHPTPAQNIVGRFFFVHESQATVDDGRLRTYEFLHATFGEYLVARFVVRALRTYRDDLAAAEERPTPGAPADDGLLFALLSFTPLTMRTPVMTFLRELLATTDGRDELRRALLLLFREAHFTRPERGFGRYEPLRLPAPARHAAYSANLLLLLTVLDGTVSTADLFPGTGAAAVGQWRSHSHLWRSQFSPEAWFGVLSSLSVRRRGLGDERELHVMSGAKKGVPPADLAWSFAITDGADASINRDSFDDVLWQSWFLADQHGDVLGNVSEPIAKLFPELFRVLRHGDDRLVSGAHELVRLWLSGAEDARELTDAYARCLHTADAVRSKDYLVFLLRRLRNDDRRMSTRSVAGLLEIVLDVEWADADVFVLADKIADDKYRDQPHAELVDPARRIRTRLPRR